MGFLADCSPLLAACEAAAITHQFRLRSPASYRRRAAHPTSQCGARWRVMDASISAVKR